MLLLGFHGLLSVLRPLKFPLMMWLSSFFVMICSLTKSFSSLMMRLYHYFLLEYSSVFPYYALDAALQFGLHWLPVKPLASLNKCLVSPSRILEVIYLNIIDLIPSMLIYKYKVYQSKFFIWVILVLESQFTIFLG